MSARERTAAHRSDESLAYGCCDAVTEPLTTYCADSWRVRASTGRARSELSPTARGVQCAVTKSIIVQRQKAAACGRVCGVLKASTRAHMYRDSREQQCSCQYSLHRRGAAAEPLAWSSREFVPSERVRETKAARRDRAGCAMSSYEDPEVEAFPAGVAKRGELTESQKELKAEREKAQMAQMLGAKARA